MKATTRSKNVFFTLQKVYQLVCDAMAGVDAEYWQKCIAHQEKEMHNYLVLDEIIEADNSIQHNKLYSSEFDDVHVS